MIKQFITFTLLFLSLMLSSTTYAQTTQSNLTDAETKKIPTVKELSDGIFVFICDKVDSSNKVPIIFIDEGEAWILSDSSEFTVTKIKDGFMLKLLGESEGFGFLKEDDNVWNLEFLSENSSFNTTCQLQEYFVEGIVRQT